MTPFDSSKYHSRVAALCAIERLSALGPGKPNEPFRPELAELGVEAAFPTLQDREAAQACISALWLYHDFLDESHAISQELPSWYGSYWHGIMHRREPDPSNAKYWFRRVSANPIYEQLAAEAPTLGYVLTGGVWDPYQFVDRCERERGSGSDAEKTLRRVQLREWQLLFDWCYRKSISR